MKKNINKKERKALFDEFYKIKYPEIVRYLQNITGDYEKSRDLPRDLVSEAFCDFIEKEKHISIPPEKWEALLYKMVRDKRADYYRKKEKNSTVSLEDDKYLGEEDPAIKKIYEDDGFLPSKRDLSPPKEYQMRCALLSPHRSLQEVILIQKAPSCKVLIKLIEDKFPILKERYRKRGQHIGGLYPDEKLSALEKKKLLNNFELFFGFLYSTAKLLKIDDQIGALALKILLLSDNPWKEWCLLGQESGEDYLSFTKEGKLYKRKMMKRPYLHFFRDYLYLSMSMPEIRKMIMDLRKTEDPELSVEEDYILKFYRMGSLNSEILKKQKFGRKNQIGLKKKIDNYEADIQKIIEEMSIS